MPTLNVNVPRVWRYRGEPGRIHFMIERPNGAKPKHLIIDEGHTLYDVFEEWFATIGYTGPKSGEQDEEP